MDSMTTARQAGEVRAGDRMTLAEYLLLPVTDDGERAELIEGVLVTSGIPIWQHQARLTELLVVLHAACPPGLRVLPGPTGVLVPSRNSALVPDLVVKREIDLPDAARPSLLVVEVASPSTRRRDRQEKRRLYAAAGIGSYWLLDPLSVELTVLVLGDAGEYVQLLQAGPDDEVILEHPFPVRFRPADLAG